MGVSKRTRQKELKKNIIAVAFILIFAIVIFSINSVGKFIAEKIIKPVADFSGIKTESISTESIKTKKIELYAVSAYSFDTLEEAQKASDTVKEQGGSGYIFQMDNKFNVLYSIKTEKDSAQSIAQSLEKSSILTLTLDEVSIKITGTKNQTSAVSDCFNIMTENSKALPEIQEKLEKGEMTALQASSKINTMKSDISKNLRYLEELNSSNVTVLALYDMLSVSYTLLDEMPDSDKSDFLSKLKYTSCAYACEYFVFLSELE